MKLLLLVLVVAGACATTNGSPPSFPRKTNLGLRILPATLPNGLRVLLVSDPNASEVQVTVRYQIGANDDPAGQEGVAHLVEHLMFQPVLGAETMLAKLQDVTTFVNATTTFDATTYTARATPARLGELLSIEAVRLGFRCASISDSVFERERQVVVNELQLREATTELYLALNQALYPEGHPYRRWNTAQTAAAITREQACAFAESHYAPSNAVLVISGPVTLEQVNELLDKHVVNVGARQVQARAVVPAAPAKSRRVDAKAPIDGNAILIAWALPENPVTQLTIGTAATRVVREIRDHGLSADPFIFGDTAAPMLGVFVELDDEEKRTTEKLLSEIQAAVGAVPGSFRVTRPAWLARTTLDRLRQGAIYRAFSELEEGSGRDEMIATAVLAGRDPNAMLVEQGVALNKLSGEALEQIAEMHLRYDQATIAVLTPSDATKRGTSVELAAPVHDIGQRREPPDPADAQRAADASWQPPRAISGMRKRTLANGLDVVLLPVTSVPTVEIRLVFGSGTADDDAAQRGAALAAAKALDWNPRYVDDLILFAAGGGVTNADVGLDHTAFTARGVDMHLDLLLTGLRRFVRDGIYDAADIDAIRIAASRGAADRRILETWRAALFGSSHPYAHVSSVSPTLTLAAIEAYRKQHHTPGNATLVIAGRFDADLAEKWIDYLFADWSGPAPASATMRVASEPVSIANDDEDVSQVGVVIAIPAGRGNRAEQLVAAAMLNVIVEDIRHQLGASYAFGASLDEARLASTYVVFGWIDAPRVRDAFELVRLRLAALRSDPEAAARTFITARRRVIVNLLRSTSSAYELAQRVQSDVVLDRAPLSDAQTAEVVNQLTIDKLPGVLEELDPARAVVVMRGPRATLDDAFAALGRTPKRIAALPDDGNAAQSVGDGDVADSEENIEDPSKPSGSRWTVGAFVGYTIASAVDHGVEGFGFGADVGYRFARRLAGGVHLSKADLEGTYAPSFLADDPVKVSVSALQLMGFFQASAADDRLWGSVFAGLSFVDATDDGMTTSSTGFSVGAHGGYDVANFSRHHITVYGRVGADLGSSTSFAAFAFGFGYRYR